MCHVQAFFAFFLAGLLVACSPAQTASSATVDLPATINSTTQLPLKPGYYVASDTPCAQASRATVLRVNNIGIAGPQEACRFQHIEQIGAGLYRVRESCTDVGDPRSARMKRRDFSLKGDTGFDAISEDGGVHGARLCELSGLPAPFRNGGIRDAPG